MHLVLIYLNNFEKKKKFYRAAKTVNSYYGKTEY